jgi:hypothetical protein
MPVIETGTFQLHGEWFSSQGDFSFNGGTLEYEMPRNAPPELGELAGGFLSGSALTGSGPWSPTTYAGAPPGFRPTTNLNGRINIHNQFFPSFNTTFFGGVIATVPYGPGVTVTGSDSQIIVPIPDFTSLFFLADLVTLEADNQFSIMDLLAIHRDTSIFVTGNYEILLWWWTIPAVNACGERSTQRFQLSAEQPDTPSGETGVYEKLDPSDPDAFPQPIIESVEPNHGSSLGGTAVTIRGSGFGEEADVQFDGVSASDIIVVSALEISCIAPPHVSGFANIVVINADGVSS